MSAGPQRHRRAVLGAALAMTALIPAAGAAERGGALLPGSSGKEPISIDAARLDYFDKEGKLVYAGEVVARQGASTLKGSTLTIFLSKEGRRTEKAADPGEGPAPAANTAIERMEVAGPVTLISKDEVGTGDNGSYDKAANKITLTGNVTLTQATNVIRGDKLVYDMTSGQAQVSSGQTQGRVRSVFTPGSGAPGGVPVRKPKGAGDTPKPASPAAKTP